MHLILSFFTGIILAIGSVFSPHSNLFAGATICNVFSGCTGRGTFTSSQLMYGNGTTPISSVATSTLSCTGLVACTSTTVVSTASSVNLAAASANTVLGNGTGASAVPTALATSTLYGDIATFLTTGNVGIGSTTPGFRFSVNTAGSEFYINSSGKVVGYDTANAWNGRLSPTHSFVLGTGTTTGWTASTTVASGYSPFLQMPFAGTLRQVRCATDASFVGVNVQVAGSNVTPSYFVASTTVGTEKFTAGNTFTAGQQILANFGTTTTSGTAQINCTFDMTETP